MHLKDMEIEISTASKKDAELLAVLGRETFYDTFAAHNTETDMSLYLSINFTNEKLHSEFAEVDSKFYIAYVDGEAAGYAKTSANLHPEPIKGKCLEIERLYVKWKYQSKKVGLQLMQHCITRAKEEDYDTIWLGVWEHNHRAIRFYERFGFKKFGEHIFLLGTDAQNDWLMQLAI